jgi:putative mRNA 3-end processing factor
VSAHLEISTPGAVLPQVSGIDTDTSRDYKHVAMSRTPGIDVEYNQGIHVLDSVLWLDAPRQTDLCFVSHAHIDPAGPHRKILTTEATAALMRRKISRARTLTAPWLRRFSLGDLDLELHPAGHMLGAAQIRVTRDGGSLVYTGDFQLGHPRTAQNAPVLKCDVLVMRATYGLPHHVFPDRQEVEAQMVSWINRTLQGGDQPVAFAPSPGKAQELASVFSAHGLRVRVHKSIYQVCRKYRALGVRLPNVRCFRRHPARDEVIIFPPHLRQSKVIASLKRARTCVATGRALDEAHQPADAAFVLSGHADHPALLRYVRESGAKKVHLAGPAAAPLAAELASAGIAASPLQPTEQMELF